MKALLAAAAAAACAACVLPAQAALVNIDLSAASSGTVVTGVGASFAQTFAGQTVSGISIVGAPTNPLALQAAGTIYVAFWGGSNSLLSQPDNQAPLSILLDSNADAFSWRMGSGDRGSVTADFFSSSGALLYSQAYSGLSGYADFSISGLPAFRGITFRDNNDSYGLRFQNMSYNAVPVPEPATWALMIMGLCVAGAAGARRAKADTTA